MKKIFTLFCLIFAITVMSINPCHADIFQNKSKQLVEAASAGNYNRVQELLNKGADADASYTYYDAQNNINRTKTALTEAIKKGDAGYPIAKLLIEKGANVSKGAGMTNSSVGYFLTTTPLFFADDPKMVKLLVDNGADINAPCFQHVGGENRAPIFYAVILSKNADFLMALVENGADVNALDEKGHTPMYYADEKGNMELYNLLKRLGGREY